MPDDNEIIVSTVDLKAETVVSFGGEIKSLGDNRIGGYLVRFTDQDSPDIEGDYFSASTDFGFKAGEKINTPVYLNHRQPLPTKSGDSVAVKDVIGIGVLEMDESGVLIDAILYSRGLYDQALTALGWSSGTAEHLIDHEQSGKAVHIKKWPLGLDASITPMPAEPRNQVIPLKSLSDILAVPAPEPKGEPEAETTAASEGEEAEPTSTKQVTQEIKNMAENETPTASVEITKDELAAMLATAAKSGAEEAIKSLPVIDPPKKVEVVEDD